MRAGHFIAGYSVALEDRREEFVDAAVAAVGRAGFGPARSLLGCIVTLCPGVKSEWRPALPVRPGSGTRARAQHWTASR